MSAPTTPTVSSTMPVMSLLKRVKKPHDICWVTSYCDYSNGVELLIGAPSKAECVKAFERVSNGYRCDSDKIVHAEIRKASDPLRRARQRRILVDRQARAQIAAPRGLGGRGSAA
jgi:hypothetical protein